MPSRRQVLGGLGTAVAGGIAGCLDERLEFGPGTDENADWPMPRFDRRNAAYSPDAAAPRDGVRERWTVEDGLASGPPVVADGTVFFPTSEALVALDAETGEEHWRFVPDDSPWPGGPAVHDGTVYVTATHRNVVYALDAATGEERWSLEDAGVRRTAPHLVSGEYVDEPVLYVGNENGVLRRLGAATGEEHWRTDLFGTVSALAYRSPVLYVGTMGGELYEFTDAVDGSRTPTEGWRRKVGSAVETIAPNAQCIAVETFGGIFRCVMGGAHAGTTRWSVDAKSANSAPVHDGSTLFLAGYDELVAIRDYDRKAHWRVGGRYDATGPVAAGDTLYASSGDAVHAFALDGGTGVGTLRFGAERWSHPTPGGATEGLAVGAGAVFAACQRSRESDVSLYCLEPA